MRIIIYQYTGRVTHSVMHATEVARVEIESDKDIEGALKEHDGDFYEIEQQRIP